LRNSPEESAFCWLFGVSVICKDWFVCLCVKGSDSVEEPQVLYTKAGRLVTVAVGEGVVVNWQQQRLNECNVKLVTEQAQRRVSERKRL
jgi:hypothetical protein